VTPHKDHQAEIKKLLKTVTPSSKAHQNYLNKVTIFINWHNHLSSLTKGHAKGLLIKKLKIVPSQIFNREYLVAYVTNDWFLSAAHKCDAVATTSLEIYNLASPPLVIAPESNSRLKNNYFLSILEHEFVHINQAILNNFPATNNYSKKPFPTLINHTLAEYQANFIQYYYFPEAYQKIEKEGYSLSMKNWSVLRGYTQALETLVQAIYMGQLTSSTVEKILKALPKQLPSGFKKIGLPESNGLDYARKLPPYLHIAVSELLKNFPMPKNEGFRTLTNWISINY